MEKRGSYKINFEYSNKTLIRHFINKDSYEKEFIKIWKEINKKQKFIILDNIIINKDKLLAIQPIVSEE